MMRGHGCKNIIFSSIATVYGDPAEIPITESYPKGVYTNPYGWYRREGLYPCGGSCEETCSGVEGDCCWMWNSHGYSFLDMVNSIIKVNGVDVPYSI